MNEGPTGLEHRFGVIKDNIVGGVNDPFNRSYS